MNKVKRPFALLLAMMLLLSACSTATPDNEATGDSTVTSQPTDGTTVPGTSVPGTVQEVQDDTTATTEGMTATEGSTEPDGTQATQEAETPPSTTEATTPSTEAAKPTEGDGKPAETNPPETTAPPATNPPATDPPETTVPPETDPPATEAPKDYTLSLNKSNVALEVGDTATLTATYDGTGSLTWSSSNTSVATVSVGKITAKSAGTAYITVTDGTKSAQCKVTVTEAIVETPTVTLTMNVTEKTITAGDTYQIDYTYTGDKSNLTWTSSNTAVATVNQSGVVTALAEGNTTIKVTDGTNTKRCKIYVEAGSAVKATDIVIVSTNAPFYDGVTKYAGDYTNVTVSTRPSEASPEVKVTSSNSSVVSVSNNGVAGGNVTLTLNFKSAGSATITITSGDGAVSKSYTINVYAGYSFHPGGGQLTPEPFASYTTRVMCANGFTETACSGWVEFTLTADQLTFSKAVSVGQSYVHSWWGSGHRYCQIVYVGQNDSGNYVFHACCG